MRHKHAELIKAWADGAEIEFNTGHGWNLARLDDFNKERWDFRIKPKEKQPVVRWLWAFFSQSQGTWGISITFYTEKEAKQILGTYRYIKLEYTRTEFPE